MYSLATRYTILRYTKVFQNISVFQESPLCYSQYSCYSHRVFQCSECSCYSLESFPVFPSVPKFFCCSLQVSEIFPNVLQCSSYFLRGSQRFPSMPKCSFYSWQDSSIFLSAPKSFYCSLQDSLIFPAPLNILLLHCPQKNRPRPKKNAPHFTCTNTKFFQMFFKYNYLPLYLFYLFKKEKIIFL
jgi:hypothetical protein